jgi:predicted membrane protein
MKMRHGNSLSSWIETMNSVKEMSAKDLQKFGFSTGLIVVLIFALFLPWLLDFTLPIWPWVLAAILILVAAVAPGRLRVVYKYWMFIGEKLGWFNSRVILGFIFFVMFVPTGLVIRLFGYDPLAKKINRDTDTYRVPRNHDEVDNIKKRMENPY